MGVNTMKKIFIILVLSFVIGKPSYANECGNDFDQSWKYTSNNSYASWTFKNKSDKSIVITHIGLKSKDGRYMADEKTNINLKPFGVSYGNIYVGDLNLDVAGTGFTRCKYGKVSSSNKSSSSSSNRSSSSSGSIWPGVIIAMIIMFVFVALGSIGDKLRLSMAPSYNPKMRKKINSQGPKLIEKVWHGNETLSKTFWLYCILIGLVVSLISGVLMGLIGNIFVIIPIIYFVWCSIGLWNSSNKYQNSRLKLNLPYGWAIAAKVWVVLNLFTVFGQTILLFAN